MRIAVFCICCKYWFVHIKFSFIQCSQTIIVTQTYVTCNNFNRMVVIILFQESSNPLAPASTYKVTAATSPAKDDITPAVLPTESVHVNLDARIPSTPKQGSQTCSAAPPSAPASLAPTASINKTSQPAVIDIPKQSVNVVQPIQSMRTIELSTGRVREGFGKRFANVHIIIDIIT